MSNPPNYNQNDVVSKFYPKWGTNKKTFDDTIAHSRSIYNVTNFGCPKQDNYVNGVPINGNKNTPKLNNEKDTNLLFTNNVCTGKTERNKETSQKSIEEFYRKTFNYYINLSDNPYGNIKNVYYDVRYFEVDQESPSKDNANTGAVQKTQNVSRKSTLKVNKNKHDLGWDSESLEVRVFEFKRKDTPGDQDLTTKNKANSNHQHYEYPNKEKYCSSKITDMKTAGLFATENNHYFWNSCTIGDGSLPELLPYSSKPACEIEGDLGTDLHAEDASFDPLYTQSGVIPSPQFQQKAIGNNYVATISTNTNSIQKFTNEEHLRSQPDPQTHDKCTQKSSYVIDLCENSRPTKLKKQLCDQQSPQKLHNLDQKGAVMQNCFPYHQLSSRPSSAMETVRSPCVFNQNIRIGSAEALTKNHWDWRKSHECEHLHSNKVKNCINRNTPKNHVELQCDLLNIGSSGKRVNAHSNDHRFIPARELVSLNYLASSSNKRLSKYTTTSNKNQDHLSYTQQSNVLHVPCSKYDCDSQRSASSNIIDNSVATIRDFFNQQAVYTLKVHPTLNIRNCLLNAEQAEDNLSNDELKSTSSFFITNNLCRNVSNKNTNANFYESPPEAHVSHILEDPRHKVHQASNQIYNVPISTSSNNQNDLLSRNRVIKDSALTLQERNQSFSECSNISLESTHFVHGAVTHTLNPKIFRANNLKQNEYVEDGGLHRTCENGFNLNIRKTDKKHTSKYSIIVSHLNDDAISTQSADLELFRGERNMNLEHVRKNYNEIMNVGQVPSSTNMYQGHKMKPCCNKSTQLPPVTYRSRSLLIRD